MSANIIISLNNAGLREQVSIISNSKNSNIQNRFDDSDELKIATPYFNPITGSAAQNLGGVKTLAISGLGTLVLAGPLSDIILSAESLKRGQISSFENALNLAGFKNYSDEIVILLKRGLTLILVPTVSKESESRIKNSYQKYGALEVRVLNLQSIT